MWRVTPQGTSGSPPGEDAGADLDLFWTLLEVPVNMGPVYFCWKLHKSSQLGSLTQEQYVHEVNFQNRTPCADSGSTAHKLTKEKRDTFSYGAYSPVVEV